MEPGAPATINQSRDAPVASTGPWEGFTRFLGRRDVLPFLLLAPVLIFFIVWNLIPTLWLLGLGFYRFSLTERPATAFRRPLQLQVDPERFRSLD